MMRPPPRYTRTDTPFPYTTDFPSPSVDPRVYVAPMSQEHACARATERLLGIEAPLRGQYIRVLFAEISRILNHLLNVTTFALDVGAMTPLLWGFEEREKLIDRKSTRLNSSH